MGVYTTMTSHTLTLTAYLLHRTVEGEFGPSHLAAKLFRINRLLRKEATSEGQNKLANRRHQPSLQQGCFLRCTTVPLLRLPGICSAIRSPVAPSTASPSLALPLLQI